MLRRRKSLSILVSMVVFFTSLTLFSSPASAGGCQANSWNWSTNCSNSTGRRSWSELTRGVQRVVRDDGEPGFVAVADGIFGGNTEDAVQMFQDHVGLDDDGVVGRDTWTALYNELTFKAGDQNHEKWSTNNGAHQFTRFTHAADKWRVKKWNGGFYRMDDRWNG